ncbi:MAG: regulatory protein RecX [Candidatus Poribacteria bacterium]|nr:regulatory protein RecX [Candidatus Poribacteria bacterium]
MKQKITDIQPHNKFPSHHQLFLDKKPFVIIPSKLVENLGLRVGLEIESQTIEKLIAADEAMRAKNFALNILRENIYSKTQMTQQLEREGFKEQTVETIIIELINSGHIRDRLFAEKWIQRRQKSNPRGRTVLKQELIEKGVDPKTAEQVLAEVKVEDEKKLALQIAQKRAKQYKRLPIHVAKRRLHGFLARRGFESETIMQVIEKVL